MQEQHTLTEQQVEHFHIFGFLVRRKLFCAEEMEQINDEFDRRLASVLRDTGPQEEHQFNNWANRSPETPYIASLLEDPRIYVPSEQLLGKDAVPVQSNSNSYFKNSSWHHDATERHFAHD